MPPPGRRSLEPTRRPSGGSATTPPAGSCSRSLRCAASARRCRSIPRLPPARCSSWTARSAPTEVPTRASRRSTYLISKRTSILVSGHLPPATVAAALDRATASWIALDAARLTSIPQEASVVLANEAAAQRLTGEPAEEAAQLLARGRRLACVTLGARGAIAVARRARRARGSGGEHAGGRLRGRRRVRRRPARRPRSGGRARGLSRRCLPLRRTRGGGPHALVRPC